MSSASMAISSICTGRGDWADVAPAGRSPSPSKVSATRRCQLGVAPSHGVQRPGLDGQLNPIGAKVQAQVTVGVLPARRDHGGCHFGAMRE